jgi:hypothetical protein
MRPCDRSSTRRIAVPRREFVAADVSVDMVRGHRRRIRERHFDGAIHKAQVSYKNQHVSSLRAQTVTSIKFNSLLRHKKGRV